MKPLTILHTEWSDGWGGQEIRIIEESKGVAARGHRVKILARPQCRILAKAREAGLATRELETRGSFDFRAIRSLRKIIAEENADIVNTHSSVDSWIGGLATRGLPVKLVRTRHLSSNVPRHAFNVVYRLPDAVVTTGEAVRRQLIQHCRLDPDRVVSIPTGVDVEKFIPQSPDLETKRALGIPDSMPVVTMVAVLRRFKRHDLFLEMATAFRVETDAIRFLIVGEGPQRANIENIINSRKIRDCVILTGHCDDVRPILALSDVVVLSSDSGEGVPQAIAQALAVGRPVVATDVGGVSELVKHEVTGLLVPPNDARSLFHAVKRLIREPALAAELGRQGREHVVRNFSKELMVQKTLDLYARLLP